MGFDGITVSGRNRFVVPVVCSALFLEGMSASSINVQAAAIAVEFELGSFMVQVLAGVFLVAYAGLLPLAGRLVDTMDQKRVFLVGVLVFGAGCALCAAAPTSGVVVAGRAVQGFGAALSAPAALALITRGTGPGETRNRAIGWYSAMGALGFSAGLALPGAIVTWLGWRASFLPLLPLVALIAAVVARRIPSAPPAGGRVDVVGALALTAGLSLLTALLGAAASISLLYAVVGGLAGATLIGVVVLRSRRPDRAIVPRGVATAPEVQVACLALAGVFAAIVASMFALALTLQFERGLSALLVGAALLPQSLSNGLLSGGGARLVGRWGAARVLGTGMAAILAGLAHLAGPGLDLPYAAGVLPATVMIGAGVALCYPACSVMAVSARPESERGSTAALLTMSQNVGGAVGLAMIAAASTVPTASSPGGHAAMVISAVLLLGFAAIAFTLAVIPRTFPRGDRHPHPTTHRHDGSAH